MYVRNGARRCVTALCQRQSVRRCIRWHWQQTIVICTGGLFSVQMRRGCGLGTRWRVRNGGPNQQNLPNDGFRTKSQSRFGVWCRERHQHSLCVGQSSAGCWRLPFQGIRVHPELTQKGIVFFGQKLIRLTICLLALVYVPPEAGWWTGCLIAVAIGQDFVHQASEFKWTWQLTNQLRDYVESHKRLQAQVRALEARL